MYYKANPYNKLGIKGREKMQNAINKTLDFIDNLKPMPNPIILKKRLIMVDPDGYPYLPTVAGSVARVKYNAEQLVKGHDWDYYRKNGYKIVPAEIQITLK